MPARTTAPLLPTDAEPLLRDVAEQARTVAADKDIAVHLQVEASPLPIRADEASLRRLLWILVDNAVKYTPRGGTVIVAGRRDATHVTISVADTGAGIAPDDQRHIFERFWRADKVRAREAGGTGLGLPIARQIADQHGAVLSVESEVGVGSSFSIRLTAETVESTDAQVVMSAAGVWRKESVTAGVVPPTSSPLGTRSGIVRSKPGSSNARRNAIRSPCPRPRMFSWRALGSI